MNIGSPVTEPRIALTTDDVRRLIDDLSSELERTPEDQRHSVYTRATAVLSTQEVSLDASRVASDELGYLVKRYRIQWM